MKKIDKNEKQVKAEKAKAIRDGGFGIIGCAAGACAGMVVKASLKAITPPAMDPAIEVGYKVGEWIIASVATTLIGNVVANELTETADGFVGVMDMIKKTKEAIEEQETEMEVATA